MESVEQQVTHARNRKPKYKNYTLLSVGPEEEWSEDKEGGPWPMCVFHRLDHDKKRALSLRRHGEHAKIADPRQPRRAATRLKFRAQKAQASKRSCYMLSLRFCNVPALCCCTARSSAGSLVAVLCFTRRVFFFFLKGEAGREKEKEKEAGRSFLHSQVLSRELGSELLSVLCRNLSSELY